MVEMCIVFQGGVLCIRVVYCMLGRCNVWLGIVAVYCVVERCTVC